ncbi:MAG: type II toxin-antitoxin system VapC family toxin [Proteobacteria bacterium]|nr:type II toxin-antitoxin system VapC family toxin [Pseudomonadota bacterium]
MIVIDASVAVAWIVASQRSRASDELLKLATKEQFVAPGLFAHEARNAVLVLERRGRLTGAQADAAIASTLDALIELEATPDHAVLALTMDIARTERLTVYDAACLELALRRRAKLASRDVDLLAAGKRREALCIDCR